MHTKKNVFASASHLMVALADKKLTEEDIIDAFFICLCRRGWLFERDWKFNEIKYFRESMTSFEALESAYAILMKHLPQAEKNNRVIFRKAEAQFLTNSEVRNFLLSHKFNLELFPSNDSRFNPPELIRFLACNNTVNLLT